MVADRHRLAAYHNALPTSFQQLST